MPGGRRHFPRVPKVVDCAGCGKNVIIEKNDRASVERRRQVGERGLGFIVREMPRKK